MHVYNNYYKKFFNFLLQYIRMNPKNINFDDNKIKKVTFTKKAKKYLTQIILMLIKYYFLKKNHMAKIIHLYTLLDIMIMMLLGHYV